MSGSIALIVVDLQEGFDELTAPRNNPDCEANISRLMGAWRAAEQPIVRVRHDSTEPDSPLRPDRPGNAVKAEAQGPVDLEVSKNVHSAFHGTPSLETWLHDQDIRRLAICGIQTNMCCETTARLGSDLGFDVFFVLDATATFEQLGPNGTTISPETLSEVTASTLAHDFCRVGSTDEAVAMIES